MPRPAATTSATILRPFHMGAALAEPRLARQPLYLYGRQPLMARLSPISVGPVRIETPVILAPMTGVTDLPFRKIVKRYGAGLTVTAMIASQAMIRETRQSPQEDRKRHRVKSSP